jgi:hypothetical protein
MIAVCARYSARAQAPGTRFPACARRRSVDEDRVDVSMSFHRPHRARVPLRIADHERLKRCVPNLGQVAQFVILEVHAGLFCVLPLVSERHDSTVFAVVAQCVSEPQR